MRSLATFSVGQSLFKQPGPSLLESNTKRRLFQQWLKLRCDRMAPIDLVQPIVISIKLTKGGQPFPQGGRATQSFAPCEANNCGSIAVLPGFYITPQTSSMRGACFGRLTSPILGCILLGNHLSGKHKVCRFYFANPLRRSLVVLVSLWFPEIKGCLGSQTRVSRFKLQLPTGTGDTTVSSFAGFKGCFAHFGRFIFVCN